VVLTVAGAVAVAVAVAVAGAVAVAVAVAVAGAIAVEFEFEFEPIVEDSRRDALILLAIAVGFVEPWALKAEVPLVWIVEAS